MGRKNRELELLTRENHEDWFRRVKLRIREKGAWIAIENTAHEYAWIRRTNDATVGSASEGCTSNEGKNVLNRKDSVEELASRFARQGGSWNIDKKKEFDLWDAKALGIIIDGLDKDDTILVDEYETAAAVWTQLRVKYCKTDKSTARINMSAIQKFVFNDDSTIDGSWTKLKEFRRKVIAANKNYASAYPDDVLFHILTSALYKADKHVNLLDGFLTQSLSVEESLKILQEKESYSKELEVEDKGLAAHRQRKKNPRRWSTKSDSDIEMENITMECYCCGSTEHLVADCEYQAASQDYARKLRLKTEKNRKNKNRQRKGKEFAKNRKNPERKSKKGHAAINSASSTSDESESEEISGLDSEDLDDEIVALSREDIRKSTPTIWALDTGASSPMTDQLHLFREGSLRKVPRISIQVGGGRLFCERKGTARVDAEDGSYMFLNNVLYVPSLGVNLISAKKLCKNGLQGSFNARKIWICSGKNIVITASQRSGLYIINHISKKCEDYLAQNITKAVPAASSFDEELTDIDPDDSEPELATTKTQRHWYRLMHRRFNHCGPAMLRKLHVVTSLQNQIKIPPSNRRICRTCKLAKMRNLTNKELSEKKKEKLELVQIDIAGPFTKSISGNRVLLQVIDNATNKTWSIPLPSKDRAIAAMRRWKKREELLTGCKLKAVRSDNAPELKKLLDEFEEIDGVQNQSTTVALSHQNGLVERDIQTAEESIRAMLKAQDLPLEFWDEAAVANAHIRNLQPRGPIINGKITCPQQAYTGIEPSIENIRVWGSKCYAYVDPKTRHRNDRHDKLMLRGREGVFMGWSEDTDKHLRMYAPDLGYVVRSSRLFVDELVPGGFVDLRLRDCVSGPHGTSVDAADRGKRGRSRREEIPTHAQEVVDKEINKGEEIKSELLDVKTDIIMDVDPYYQLPQNQTTDDKLAHHLPTEKVTRRAPSSVLDSHGNGKQNCHLNEVTQIRDPRLISTQTPIPEATEVVNSIHDKNNSLAEHKGMAQEKQQRKTQQKGQDKKKGNEQGKYRETHLEIRHEENESTPPINVLTEKTTPVDKQDSQKNSRYYFRERIPKRRRPEDIDVEERDAKIIRSMMAWITDSQEVEEIAFPSIEVPENHLRVYGKNLSNVIEKAFLVALTNEQDIYECAHAFSSRCKKVVNGISIPQNYREAINDPSYSEKWKQAIQEEIKSLVENGTWEEFVLPNGANLVSTKWVFDIKKTVFGEIERFKARLVARGFSQKIGIDYTETFAPTVRAESLRMFLAMVAKEDLDCVQYDIKNAFTESHIKEQIFLAPPEGYKVKKGHVLRALRSLYGLKQAGRDWNLLLRKFLIEKEFFQSKADPCVYTNKQRDIRLLVYVDDIIAASSNHDNLTWLYEILSTRFNTKNLGEVSKILGIRITRDRKNKTLYMDQELYLEDVCNSFGITKPKYKMRNTPASNLDSLLASHENEVPIDSTQFSRIIGKIMFGMVYTRPDLAYTLGRLSQFMKNPVERHGHALKWLIQYIRSTLKQRLRFGPGGAHQNTMGIYSDADWASDKTDRKSISGGIGIFYGGPFAWASKKQNSVSTSSTESEYIALAMFAKVGQWAAQVWKDLGVPHYINSNQERTVQMFGDNQGALALVKNPHLHERSKHIDICYHVIRDLAENKRLEVAYIPTANMVADGMTKPLARITHRRFRKQLGVVDSETLESKRERETKTCAEGEC